MQNCQLNARETDDIMDELAKLTLYIRVDILGEKVVPQAENENHETNKIILANNDIYTEKDMYIK
jgi:hypothetical protein